VVARVNVPAAFGIGFVLDLRPKALLLSTAAGLVLGPARLGPLAFAVTLVLFVVVGSSSVTIPVVFALVRPEAAVTSLQSARSWLQTKSRTVTVVALIVIGTVVIGSGLTKF
jgi:hypothetical protein